jgi:hypothetical protein
MRLVAVRARKERFYMPYSFTWLLMAPGMLIVLWMLLIPVR